MTALEIILLTALVVSIIYGLTVSVNLNDARENIKKHMILIFTQASIIQQYQKELQKYRHENKEVVPDDTGGTSEGVKGPIH